MADYFSQNMQDIVRIKNIGTKSAIGITKYNAEIKIPWGNNLPDNIPEVGESWLVEKIAGNRWKFINKLGTGDYSTMNYAIELHARDCVNRERVVIDDITHQNFNEVYLVIAEDNSVYYDSDYSEAYNLKKYKNVTENIINRVKYYGLNITLVIDCKLFKDTSSDIYNQYQQKIGDTFSSNISFAAPTPFVQLIDELTDKYSKDINGICLKNFYTDGELGDSSIPSLKKYYEKHNKEPIYTSQEWKDHQSELQVNFIQSITAVLRGVPLSILTTDKYIRDKEGGVSGRLLTHIQGDIYKYVSSLGIPLNATKHADSSLRLNYFEFYVTANKSVAGTASPLYYLSINNTNDIEGMLSILSKHGANRVLINDYDSFVKLDSTQTQVLKTAMNKYSVTEIIERPSIGVFYSDNSLTTEYTNSVNNNLYRLQLENLCAMIGDYTPYKIRILGDYDIINGINDVSILVVFMAGVLSDKQITAIKNIAQSGVSIAMLGRTGLYDTDGEERLYPFLDYFNEQSIEQTSYIYQIDITDEVTGNYEGYALQRPSLGIVPALQVNKAKSYIEKIGEGGEIIKERNEAPLYIKDRNVYLAMDISDEVILNLALNLILFVAGR